MKTVISFILGVMIGGFVVFYLNITTNTPNSKYLKTDKDYYLHNGSTIKSGTSLKIDEGMSEGFTRYILYINAKSISGVVVEEKYSIIPYWIKN